MPRKYIEREQKLLKIIKKEQLFIIGIGKIMVNSSWLEKQRKKESDNLNNNINLNKEYIASLEKLVELSEKEYYTFYVDLNRTQSSVAKTLLWIAFILFGLHLATFKYLYSLSLVFPSLSVMLLLLLASISVVMSFTLSALSISSSYRKVHDDGFLYFSEKAYQHLEKYSDNLYLYFLNELLEKFDLASLSGEKIASSRGIKLRISTYLCLFSVVVYLFGVVMFFYYNKI